MFPPAVLRNFPAAQVTQVPPVEGQVLPVTHVEEQDELDEHDELPATEVFPPRPKKTTQQVSA